MLPLNYKEIQFVTKGIAVHYKKQHQQLRLHSLYDVHCCRRKLSTKQKKIFTLPSTTCDCGCFSPVDPNFRSWISPLIRKLWKQPLKACGGRSGPGRKPAATTWEGTPENETEQRWNGKGNAWLKNRNELLKKYGWGECLRQAEWGCFFFFLLGSYSVSAKIWPYSLWG